MWLATLILLHTPATLDVTLQPLSGVRQAGALVELDNKRIVLKIDGKEQPFETRDVLTLVLRDVDPASAGLAGVWIELVDGSHVVGESYRVTNRVATVKRGKQTVSIETRNIRAVRFHAPAEALDTQWREILEGDNSSDVIVLRRSKTALDQLEGIFHDVTDETVAFEYDDRRIPVKRTKLEGLIYHHPAGRNLPDSICTVKESNGSQWRARSVQLQQEQLAIVTTSGTKCQLPWDAIAQLDFSSGNVAYLSDLEFELEECTPYIASRVSPQRILQLYGPRRDHGFEGNDLWLSRDNKKQRYAKGLAIHSRSKLVFRLREPYRRLTAVIGIDCRSQGRGNVVLVIEGDNRELLRRTISGTDAPIDLDLDLEGIRRLRIFVDFGESLDVADHLNLCNARIIK